MHYLQRVKFNLKKVAGVGLVSVATVSGAAFAQSSGSIDVSSVTAVIAQVVTAAATIGAAVLAMHFGIKAYKWIRSAG
jgi:hypothetical protein